MSDLRKLAADVFGRAALEERFGTPRLSAVEAVLQAKTASADPELLKVAASFNTGETMNVYEDLGGSFSSKAKE